MPAPVTRLFDFADALLGALVDAFADASVDLPAMQFVHSGEVAYDCELLAVGFERLALGQPGAEDVTAIRCAKPRSATFAVHLLRCVPTPASAGTTPPADALNGSAAQLLTDAWILLTGTVAAYREAAICSLCSEFSVVGLDPYGPSGAMGGSVLRVRAQV